MSKKTFISFSDLPVASMKASLMSPVSALRKGGTDGAADVSPVYVGGDSELSMLSRKLLKKDVITRVKAVSELIEAFKTRDETTVAGFMSFFNFAFARLVVVDNSAKVRDGMVGLLRALVEAGRKAVRPHLAHLLPHWWQACSDAAPEVARAATEALVVLFPVERKRLEVLLLPRHCTAVCAALHDALQHSAASLQEVAAAAGLGDADEAAERHERCLVSALQALASLVVHTASAQAVLPGEGSGAVDALHQPPQLEPVRALLQEDGFWRRLNGRAAGASAVPLAVRLAMAELLHVICRHNKKLMFTSGDAMEPSAALVRLCRVVSSQRLLLTPFETAEGAPPVSEAATSLCVQTWIALVDAYPSVYWDAGQCGGGRPGPVLLLEVLREQVALRPAAVCPWLVLVVATLPLEHTCGVCPESAHLQRFLSFLRGVALAAEEEAEAGGGAGRRGARAPSVPLRDHVNCCIVEIATLLLLRKRPIAADGESASSLQLLLTDQPAKSSLVELLVEASAGLLSDYLKADFASSVVRSRPAGGRGMQQQMKEQLVPSQVACVRRVWVQVLRSLGAAPLPLRSAFLAPFIDECVVKLMLSNIRGSEAGGEGAVMGAERNRFVVQFVGDALASLDAPELRADVLAGCVQAVWAKLVGDSSSAPEVFLVGAELLYLQMPAAASQEAGGAVAVAALMVADAGRREELVSGCIEAHPAVLQAVVARLETASRLGVGAQARSAGQALFARTVSCLLPCFSGSARLAPAGARLVHWCVENRQLVGVSVAVCCGLLQSGQETCGSAFGAALHSLLRDAVGCLAELDAAAVSGQPAASPLAVAYAPETVTEFVALFAAAAGSGAGADGDAMIESVVRESLLTELLRCRQLFGELEGAAGRCSYHVSLALLSCFGGALALVAAGRGARLAQAWTRAGDGVGALYEHLQVEACCADLFFASSSAVGCGATFSSSKAAAGSTASAVLFGDCHESQDCAQELLAKLLLPLRELDGGAGLAAAVLRRLGRGLGALLVSCGAADGVACSADQWARWLHVTLDAAHAVEVPGSAVQLEVLCSAGLTDPAVWRHLAAAGAQQQFDFAVQCLYAHAVCVEARTASGSRSSGGLNAALLDVRLVGEAVDACPLHAVLLVAIARALVLDVVAGAGAAHAQQLLPGILSSAPSASADLNAAAALLLLCSRYHADASLVPLEMSPRVRLLEHLLLLSKSHGGSCATVSAASQVLGPVANSGAAAVCNSFAELLVKLAPLVSVDRSSLLEARGRGYSMYSTASEGDADAAEETDAFAQLFRLIAGAGSRSVADAAPVCTVHHATHHSVVVKGSALSYIDRSRGDAADGFLTQYTCAECRVVQVHTEEYPAHPVYYTVQLLQARERQTEGHRLLLGWRGGTDCADAVAEGSGAWSADGADEFAALAAHESLRPIREHVARVRQLKGDFAEVRQELAGAASVALLQLARSADAGAAAPALRGTVCRLLTVVPARQGGKAVYAECLGRVRYGLVLLQALLHAAAAASANVRPLETGEEEEAPAQPAYCFVQNGLWLCEVVRLLRGLVAARRATSLLAVPTYLGAAGGAPADTDRAALQKALLRRLVAEELEVAVALMESPKLQQDAGAAELLASCFAGAAEVLESLAAGTPARDALSCLLLRALACLFRFKTAGVPLEVGGSPSPAPSPVGAAGWQRPGNCPSESWELLGARFAVGVLTQTHSSAGGTDIVLEGCQRQLACSVLHRALFHLPGGTAMGGRGRGKLLSAGSSAGRAQRTAAGLALLAQSFCGHPPMAGLDLSTVGIAPECKTFAAMTEDEYASIEAMEQRLLAQMLAESSAPRVLEASLGLGPLLALSKTVALLNESSEFVLFAAFGHCPGNHTAARKGQVQQVLAQIAEQTYQEQYQRSLHGVRSAGAMSKGSVPLPAKLMEMVFGARLFGPLMAGVELLRGGHGLSESQRLQLLLLWVLLLQRLSTLNLTIAEFHVKSCSGTPDESSLSDVESELLDLLLAVRGEVLRFLYDDSAAAGKDGAGCSVFELMLAHVVLCYAGNDTAELHAVLQLADSCGSVAQGSGGVHEAWCAAAALSVSGGVWTGGSGPAEEGLARVWRDATVRSAAPTPGEPRADPALLQAFALLRTVLTCPTLFRRWYDDCEYGQSSLKRAKPALLRFVEVHVSSTLISREMELITLMQREQELVREQQREKKRLQKQMVAERLAKQARQREQAGREGGDGPVAPAPALSAKARAVVEDDDEQEESLHIVGRTSAYAYLGSGSSSSGGGGSTQGAGGIEISATYHRDDTTIELKIKLGAAYPLKNAEVEASSLLGISKERWQRWKLQIIQLLTNSSFSRSKMGAGAAVGEGVATPGCHGCGESSDTGGGSITEAIFLWKENIDKEFEGVEPCPICYSIVHISGATSTASNASKFPSMECRTCHNKFHSVCLHQWFKSSGKSKCVICQQPFFGADS